MNGGDQAGAGRRLTLSRETLRDLEPSADVTAAVRGGTLATLCGTCFGCGNPDRTYTEGYPGGAGGAGGGVTAFCAGTAACKGTIKVTYEIDLDVTASKDVAALMKKQGGPEADGTSGGEPNP
jgi:hypothetical protein